MRGRLRQLGARVGGAVAAARELLANRAMLVGLIVLGLFVVMALAEPVLRNTIWDGANQRIYDPRAGFDVDFQHPAGPSLAHPLGTDPVGRDVLSILLAATLPTLAVAAVAAVTTAVVSVVTAAVAAYYRGWIDGLLSQVANALVLLPAPIVLLVVGFARPQFLTPTRFGLLYGALFGVGAASLVVRSHALIVMEKPFIAAARLSGGGAIHIIRRHLVPHLLPLAAIQMMVAVTGAIVVQAFIDFLGHTERDISFGALIYYGLDFQLAFGSTTTPWGTLLAGTLSISTLVASFHLLSVGLRQLYDPAFHGRRAAS